MVANQENFVHRDMTCLGLKFDYRNDGFGNTPLGMGSWSVNVLLSVVESTMKSGCVWACQ